MSRKNIYKLADIDDNIMRFSQAYLKKVVTTSKKNYYRRLLKNKNEGIRFEEYNDNLLYSTESPVETTYIPRVIKINEISIHVESEVVYQELNKLTDKQRTVFVFNFILQLTLFFICKQKKTDPIF